LNVTDTMENTDGESIAAATPCRILAVINMPGDVAIPHRNEKLANAIKPAMNNLRRPRMSPMRPPSSRNPPNVRAYPDKIHWRFA
jgi:hypothetical protein